MIGWEKIRNIVFWAQRLSFGVTSESVAKSYKNAMKICFFAFEVAFAGAIFALLLSSLRPVLPVLVLGILCGLLVVAGVFLGFLGILYGWFLMFFSQSITSRLSDKIDLFCSKLWD